MKEVTVQADWIRERVEPATELEAWENNHPGDQRDVVVYNLNRGNPTRYSNAGRVLYTGYWLVWAVTAGADTVRPDEVASQIDSALELKSEEVVTDGYRIIECKNDYPMRQKSMDLSGNVFRHHGFIYRIKCLSPQV